MHAHASPPLAYQLMYPDTMRPRCCDWRQQTRSHSAHSECDVSRKLSNLPQVKQNAPWRAQFVDALPYVLPFTATAFAVPTLARRSDAAASTSAGSVGVSSSRSGSGSIPDELRLLTYDPDVYLSYFLRRPVFALWCVPPLPSGSSAFLRLCSPLSLDAQCLALGLPSALALRLTGRAAALP